MLLDILEWLDAKDMIEEATRLGTVTTSLFAEAYHELAEEGEPPRPRSTADEPAAKARQAS